MVISSVYPAVPEIYGNLPAKKAEETAHESFAETFSNAVSANVSEKSNTDIVDFSEAGTGKISVNGSYSVTEEQAEYFREKYGEEYDEDKVCELYYQLADNGIITENSACGASGHMAVRRVEFDGPVPFLGYGKCDLVSLINSGAVKVRSGERRLVKSVQFTDDDPDSYKAERDLFESQYDREVVTWVDALQKECDFYKWWKDYAFNDITGEPQPSQRDFDIMIADLEKTKDVIMQIFD